MSTIPSPRETASWRAWAGTAAVVLAATLVGSGMFAFGLERTDIAMSYLLAVVVIAVRWGRAPSAVASILCVAAFNFFFVPPYFTLQVHDSSYFVTFAVMLAVGLVVSTLTVRLREAAVGAARREKRMTALYALGRELSSAGTRDAVVDAAARHVEDALEGRVLVLVPRVAGGLEPLTGRGTLAAFDTVERRVAEYAFEHREAAGFATAVKPNGLGTYLPLVAAGAVHGVIGVLSPDDRLQRDPERWRLYEAFADLTALALERVRLAKEAQEAVVRARAEETRSALLSSVSHDLRTPLATITGAASAMAAGSTALDAAAQQDLSRTIVEEGRRLDRLVTNLLQATRLQGGARLQKEWASVAEIADAALRRLDRTLSGRRVELAIDCGLPMVEVDEVLVESALANLLENAAKHTPEGAPITIAGREEGGRVVVEVADRGPGIPAGSEERIFGKFERGTPSDDGASRGVGLGLAIVRAVVEAHGGTATAGARAGGGAVFRLTLPRDRETPPVPLEAA